MEEFQERFAGEAFIYSSSDKRSWDNLKRFLKKSIHLAWENGQKEGFLAGLERAKELLPKPIDLPDDYKSAELYAEINSALDAVITTRSKQV